MGDSKHTPGPWQVVAPEKAEHQWVVGDAQGGSIASCEPMGPWMTAGEADANAKLIAATPDLAHSVEMLLQLCNHASATAFSNGVTDPTGSIDEGDVIASRIMHDAKEALRKAGLL